MRKIKVFLVMVLSTGPGRLGAGAASARAAGERQGPMCYNPQTVTTVTGQVEKLEELPSMGRGGAGYAVPGRAPQDGSG